jgi:hypothetical protein
VRVKIPRIIDDPYTVQGTPGNPYETTTTLGEEDFFLDGPMTRRVAVLDFAPDTGALAPGVQHLPPAPGKDFGGYRIAEPIDIYSHELIQVSTFATVLETMALFEEPDALGRPLAWAFNAPQLLVVPRAGEWANAFYERESHSLQFFFLSPAEPGKPKVYASLSRDIVAHETAHAILDGIAPTLYNSITPQALALHEAIADLTALLISFRSRKLRSSVLERTGGKLDDSTAFSAVAQEFAQARDGKSQFLRNLCNQKTLDPNDPNRVNRFEPHALSEVLSGALYGVFVRIYNGLRAEHADWPSGKALFVAGERLKRMTLRALDYLPPGEISFADYGRALLASDQAGYPKEGEPRQWLRDEFVKRFIVPQASALDVATNFPFPPLGEIDLQNLIDQDWLAYGFADRCRDFLHIPPGVPFHVYPRLKSTKSYIRQKGSDDEEQITELIFKVSWDEKEPNPRSGPGRAPERQVRRGTTLAVDWETRNVRACLTSDSSPEQSADRDLLLRELVSEGADAKSLCAAVQAETIDGVLHVRGAARMLHLDLPGQGAAPAVADRLLPPPGVDAGAFYDLVDFRRRGYGKPFPVAARLGDTMPEKPKIPRVCIDMELPEEMQVAAAERAIAENPANLPAGGGSPFSLAVITGKKWQNGRTLRVRFLDGQPEIQAKVQQFAVQWMDFANIKFAFDNSPDAEIRVSFTPGLGSWSYMGTDNLSIPRDKPTMNYGWFDADTDDEEYSRTVLHEFGHALGCIHEHQHPDTDIPWDREAAYAYYLRTNNWSRAQVDQQVFQRYSRAQTQFSAFDKDSIMEYPVDEALTIGNFSIGWNRHLSPTDKTFIASCYPKDKPADAFQELPLGTAVQGEIGKPGEADLYKLTVAQQGRYTVETTGPTDTFMSLSGPNDPAKLIAEDDDAGQGHNAKIRTDLAPGTYWVRVRHFKPTGTGQYSLTARRG